MFCSSTTVQREPSVAFPLQHGYANGSQCNAEGKYTVCLVQTQFSCTYSNLPPNTFLLSPVLNIPSWKLLNMRENICWASKNINTRGKARWLTQPPCKWYLQFTQGLCECLMYKNVRILSDKGFYKRPRSRNAVFRIRTLHNAVLFNALWSPPVKSAFYEGSLCIIPPCMPHVPPKVKVKVKNRPRRPRGGEDV